MKNTDRNNAVWTKDVMLNPSITTTLKKKQPMPLQDISIRKIQHRLQKDLSLPSRYTDKKPLLTSPVMKRLQFCNGYLHWTSADRKTIIISDESTLRLVRWGSKLVRRPPGSSKYYSKSMVNTVKYTESVMVCGAFSGNSGRLGSFIHSQEHYLDWSHLFVGSGAAYVPRLGHPSVSPLHAWWCSFPYVQICEESPRGQGNTNLVCPREAANWGGGLRGLQYVSAPPSPNI